MCVVGVCGCFTMSATTSNSKGSNKRGRKDSQLVDRDQNVLCVLQKHCTNDELGYLVVQQENLDKEAQEERHDNTNNPGKGKADGNVKDRLLNLVLVGDRKFPQPVMARLQSERLSEQQSELLRPRWVPSHRLVHVQCPCGRFRSGPLSQSLLLECLSYTSVSRKMRVSDEHERCVSCRAVFRVQLGSPALHSPA